MMKWGNGEKWKTLALVLVTINKKLMEKIVRILEQSSL